MGFAINISHAQQRHPLNLKTEGQSERQNAYTLIALNGEKNNKQIKKVNAFSQIKGNYPSGGLENAFCQVDNLLFAFFTDIIKRSREKMRYTRQFAWVSFLINRHFG